MAELTLPPMTPLACSCLSLKAFEKYFVNKQIKECQGNYKVKPRTIDDKKDTFIEESLVNLDNTTEPDYIRAFIFWLNYYSTTGLEEINLVLGAYLEKMSKGNQKAYFNHLSEKQKLYLLEHGIKFADKDTEKGACESTEAYTLFARKIENNIKGMSNPKKQKEEFSKLSSVGLKRAVLPALSDEAKPSSGLELTKGIAKLIGYGALLVGCFLSDLIISQISKPATEFLKAIAHQRISDWVAEITVGFVASGIFYIAEEKALEGLSNNGSLDNYRSINYNNTYAIKPNNDNNTDVFPNQNNTNNENDDINTPLIDNTNTLDTQRSINPSEMTLYKIKSLDSNTTYTSSLSDNWNNVSPTWKSFKEFVLKNHTSEFNVGSLATANNNNNIYSQMQNLYDQLDLTEMNKKLSVGDMAKSLQNEIAFMFDFQMSYIEQFGANDEIYNDLIGTITLMNEPNQMKYIAGVSNFTQQLQQDNLNISQDTSNESLPDISSPDISSDSTENILESNEQQNQNEQPEPNLPHMSEDMLIELLNRGLVLQPEVLEKVSQKSLIGWQFKNYIKLYQDKDGYISKGAKESIVNHWEKLSYGERMLTYPVLLDYGIAPAFSVHKKRAAKLAVNALALVCFCSGILTACLTPIIPIAPAITGLLFSIGFSTLELCNIKFFEPAAKRYEQNYDMQQAYEKTSLKKRIEDIKNQTQNKLPDKSTDIPTFSLPPLPTANPYDINLSIE